jgi:hypothetical protein
MTALHGGVIAVFFIPEGNLMNRTTRARAVRSVAPVAGLLAAGLLVWQGSYAAFNATTNNTSDAWSTGNLALTNNGGTATYAGTTTALFTESGIKIDQAAVAKCITVESTGTLPGNLRLFRSAITGNAKSAALGAALKVTVEAAGVTAATNVAANCTGFPVLGITTLHNAVSLSALPIDYATASGVGVLTGTQRVAYRITYTLPTTGNQTNDNALQTATAQTDLTWEIQ